MKQSGQSGRGQLIPLCYITTLTGFTQEAGERNFWWKPQLFEIFLNIYFCLLFLATASFIFQLSPFKCLFFKPPSWRNVSIYQLVRDEWLSRPSHPLSRSLPILPHPSCNSVRPLQGCNVDALVGFVLLDVLYWDEKKLLTLHFLPCEWSCSDSSLVFLCVSYELM